MSYYKGMGLQMPDTTVGNPIKPVSTGGKDLEMYQNSEGSAMKYATSMEKNIPIPGKTTGGAVTSGLAGAGAGASIGAAVGTGASTGSSAGPWGALIGAIVGAAGYYLS